MVTDGGGVVTSMVDISVCICWFLYTVVVWCGSVDCESQAHPGRECTVLLYLHSVFDRGSEARVAEVLGHVVRTGKAALSKEKKWVQKKSEGGSPHPQTS